jgi:probable rRNA maturation factor
MSGLNKAERALSFQCASERRGVPAAASFHQWVDATLKAMRRRRVALAIRVVGAAEASALNQSYRQRDYAPNVLSFPAGDYRVDGRLWLGDIAICREVVLQQALDQGKTPRDHFAHMTVHGVLHLLGHDHQNTIDAERMETLEIKILATKGIASPY